ncbi:HNH endonuclease [Phycicoccus sp. Soil748]|uniref:HNH endonuclease n=1 Tax=Intrasporangiaceae TaxID=85021 RepID=UPI0009E8EB19|nr:HNH endonuclease [Phycicoccus sp. Soil748]
MDALELGQRIVAILETGRRTATYKFALLMSLVDYCVENLPAEDVPLSVPLEELGERVIALYWRQVLPLAGIGELKQSSQPRVRILAAVSRLRESAYQARTTSLDVARERVPNDYRRAVTNVVLTLVRQPLARLQHLPGREPGQTFLYDDSWMGEGVNQSKIDRHGAVVTLYPGVATNLARLSGLLRPTLELLWVEDVVRLNASLRNERIDVASHLFGQERVGLARVRAAYFDEFGASCFYCGAKLDGASPIDHLLPWSRVGLDGLANLVPACRPCNSSKSSALPVHRHVTRALDRDIAQLARIGAEIGWPVQRERTVGAARGLYLSAPQGTPLWESRSGYSVVDLRWAETPWLMEPVSHR